MLPEKYDPNNSTIVVFYIDIVSNIAIIIESYKAILKMTEVS